MADQVRIDYYINAQGEPETRKLGDAANYAQQAEAKLAESLRAMELAAGQTLGVLRELAAAQERLTASVTGGRPLLEAGQSVGDIEGVKRSVSELLSITQQISDNRIQFSVDSSQVQRVTAELMALRSLQQEVLLAAGQQRALALPAVERAIAAPTVSPLGAAQLPAIGSPESSLIPFSPSAESRRNQAISALQSSAEISVANDAVNRLQQRALPRRDVLQLPPPEKIIDVRAEPAEEIGEEERARRAEFDARREDLRRRREIAQKGTEAERIASVAADFDARIVRKEDASGRPVLGSTHVSQADRDAIDGIITEAKRIGQSHNAQTFQDSFEEQNPGSTAARETEDAARRERLRQRQERFRNATTPEERSRIVEEEYNERQATRNRGFGRGPGGPGGPPRPPIASLPSPEEAPKSLGQRIGAFASSIPVSSLAIGAGAIGIAALADGMFHLVEGEGKAAEGLQNLASRMGLTVNQTSALSAEAEIAGVNIASIVGASRILSQALEDPAGSGKKAAAALREMGVAVFDASGNQREMGAVTLDVIDRLSRYATASERAFEATRVLGRGAKELLPLIEQHQELKRTVEALGYGNVEELTKKLGAADDEIDKMTLAWKLFKKELASTAAPIITPIIQGITGTITQRDDHGRTPEERQGFLNRVFDYKHGKGDFSEITQADVDAAEKREAKPEKDPAAVNPKAKAVADQYLDQYKDQKADLQQQLKETRAQLVVDEGPIRNPQGIDDPNVIKSAINKAKDDREKIARLEAQIKPGVGKNFYQSELDRINIRQERAESPASEEGRGGQLRAELERDLNRYRRQKGLRPSEREDLIRRRTEASSAEIGEADSQFEARDERKRFSTARINTDAELEQKRLEAQTAERLASASRAGKSETVAEVNRAYERQLHLIEEIRAAELKDLNILSNPKNKEERGRDEAQINRRADADKARAVSDRTIRSAEIQTREREDAIKTREEISRIDSEAEQRGFQSQIDHAQRLAEIRRRDTDSPVASVEQAYQSQIAISQLGYQAELQRNQTIEDANRRKVANEQALKGLIEDRQRAEYEREERLAQLKKQEQDEAKSQAASLYDALKGGPKGLSDFVKQQSDQIGRNLFAEFFGPAIQKTNQVLNPTGGGILGAATRGTIFGTSNGSSQYGNVTGTPGFLPGPVGSVPGFPGGQIPTGANGQPIGLPGLPGAGLPAGSAPLVLSLDRNRIAVDNLTQALLRTNLDSAGAVDADGDGTPDSLSATSLLRANQRTTDAVHVLVRSHSGQNQPIQTGRSSSARSEEFGALPSLPSIPNISVSSSDDSSSDDLGGGALPITTSGTGTAGNPIVVSAPAVTPAAISVGGFAGGAYSFPTGSGAAPSPSSKFAKDHPELARYGGAIEQLAVSSLPGIATRNPAAIATSALADLQILTGLFDRRKAPTASSPESGFGKILDGFEKIIGVETPTQRKARLQHQLSLPTSSGNGPLPQSGQSIPGHGTNTGTVLTRLPSGLILRQPVGEITATPPTVEPSALPGADPLSIFPLPTPPPFGGSSNPFALPTPPPFEGHSGTPGFELVRPDSDAAHAAILDNGLSRTADFSSGGANVSLDVLNAANPFRTTGTTIGTLFNATEAALTGLGASGLFDGKSGDGGKNGDGGSGNNGDGPSDGGSEKHNPLEVSQDVLKAGAGVYAGIKEGGAKGGAKAAAAGLGVAAKYDPEPISKAILGITAAVAGIVGAVLGSPKANRQVQLAEEIQGEKIAAFGFTQPGLSLTESAAGGNAISEDYLGGLRVSNGRPVVSTVNRAVGYDAKHPDRVITRGVRDVTLPTGVDGDSYATVLPASTTDLTPNPVSSFASPQGLASLMSGLSNSTSYSNTFHINAPVNAIDNRGFERYGTIIADLVNDKLRTSTHPLGQTVRDTVRAG